LEWHVHENAIDSDSVCPSFGYLGLCSTDMIGLIFVSSVKVAKVSTSTVIVMAIFMKKLVQCKKCSIFSIEIINDIFLLHAQKHVDSA
jgi:hypothetical protein